MRIQLPALLLGMMSVIGASGVASADDQPGYEISGYSFNLANNAHFAVGYVFTTTKTITIDALGVIDFGGNTIANAGQSFPVALYYSAAAPAKGGDASNGHTSGDPVLGASALVSSTDPILALNGSAYSGGDGFRYHTLASPITLDAETYELVSAELGTGYAYAWTGTTRVSGVGSPSTAVYSSTPTNSADYQVDPAAGFLPGLAGPNFLVSVPEPATVGIVALFGLGVRRRRA